MWDSVWRIRALKAAGLLGMLAAAWYGWVRVDWYAYFDAVPPDQVGEVVDDPHAEITKLTFDSADVLQGGGTARAGEYFKIEARLKLDPQYWRVPLWMAQSWRMSQAEHQRLRDHETKANLMDCEVWVAIVRKSWLANGEKIVRDIGGTDYPTGKEGIRWSTSAYLPHPGVYLVRVSVGERVPFYRRPMEGWIPAQNQRILKTFLVTILPPKEKTSQTNDASAVQ
jgi:hypothetical protein